MPAGAIQIAGYWVVAACVTLRTLDTDTGFTGKTGDAI
jgi:hypothetical protein